MPFPLELKLNILFFSTCSTCCLVIIVPWQRWNALLFVSVFLAGSQQWKRGEALSSHGLHPLTHGRMPWCCTEVHCVCGQLSRLGMSKTGLWESHLSWVSMTHMVVLPESPWSHHFLWFCQHPLDFLVKGRFYSRACGGSRCCEDGRFDEVVILSTWTCSVCGSKSAIFPPKPAVSRTAWLSTASHAGPDPSPSRKIICPQVKLLSASEV